MDYQGRSVKEGSADPALLVLQGEVKTLQEKVIALAATDQICSVEAQALAPASPFQPSYRVEQLISLIGNEPPLYDSAGYVSLSQYLVVINLYSSPNLYFLTSSVDTRNIIGIRWERTASDDTDVNFHVTGCATFMLLSVPVEVSLRSRYVYSSGRVVTFDYNSRRVPARSSETSQTCQFNIDEFIFADLSTFDAQYVDFHVVLNYNFGTTPMYTNTLTGGWDTQYRNFLRVKRVR